MTDQEIREITERNRKMLVIALATGTEARQADHDIAELLEEIGRLQAERDAEIGWISVKERLPEPGQCVLIWVANSQMDHPNYQTAIYEPNVMQCVWRADGGPCAWFMREVTHWMPLPEPPKGG